MRHTLWFGLVFHFFSPQVVTTSAMSRYVMAGYDALPSHFARKNKKGSVAVVPLTARFLLDRSIWYSLDHCTALHSSTIVLAAASISGLYSILG